MDSIVGELAGTVTVNGDLSITGTASGNGSGLTNVNAAQLGGQNSAYFTDASNISTGTLDDGRLSGNVALYNAATANFTGALQQGGDDVCTISGNCAGVGGVGDITGNGTANRIAMFDAAKNIINSTLLQGTGSLTLDGGNDFILSGGDLDVTGTGTFTGVVSGDDAVNNNEFVTLGQLNGVIGGLGGVDSLNTLEGALTLQGTAGQIAILDNGTDIITLSLDPAVTLQGNTFNGANQLVQLTAGGILPILDGSNLTNVNAITLQGNNAAYFTNANNISTGTLSDSRLSPNVALYNAVTANFTGTLQHGGNTVCTVVGNCAGVGGVGDILNNGNSFGAAVTIGTNDNFALNFETNGVTVATLTTAGQLQVPTTGVSGGLLIGGDTICTERNRPIGHR